MADVGSNDLGWPWKAGCEESIFFRRILITLGRSATSLHLCIAWFFSDSWVSCLFRYFYVTDILSLLFRWKICSPAVRQNSEKGESWHFGHFRGIPQQKHINVINIAGYSGRYYPLDAMRMRGLCCCHVSVRPSVRPSVCLSVTLVDCFGMVEESSNFLIGPIGPLFWGFWPIASIPNSKRNPVTWGAKYTRVGKTGDFWLKSPFI